MRVTTITSRAFNQNTSAAKKAADSGPVVITDHGRPAHVLLNYAEYERLERPRKSLAEIFAVPHPAADVDIEFPRSTDPPRDIDLS